MNPPPGSLGLPFVGEALKFLANPFEFTLTRTRQHGTVWKTRIMGDTVVFFAGPEAFSFFMDPDNFTRQNGSPKFIQEMLHPDAVPFIDGERFLTRKRLLLSAFTEAALASYLPNIFAIAERYAAKWITDESPVPIVPDLVQEAFDIADNLFAASDPTKSNTVAAADFTTFVNGSFAPPINLPFTAYGKAIRARDRLRVYIKNAVATRDGDGTALGYLKTARGPNGEQLSAQELEIELLHFFSAAHGGLTAAFAWMFVVLGAHPDLAARVRAEADAKLGDGVPTLAQARSLDLARAVSREVLRAYPIAPSTFIGVAKKDLEIDGMSIKAGWKGAGAIWATLQDGATFTDPTAFKGERLGDAAHAALPANAFVPQGGFPQRAGGHDGHRCAGEALIQLILPAFLGWFTRRFDIVYPTQDATPGPGALGPLPKSGVRIQISKRS